MTSEIEALRAEIQALRRDLTPPPQLLSIRQAAKYLGVSACRTLGPLVASGAVRTVVLTPGARPKIPLEEVQRIAREGVQAPVKPARRVVRKATRVDPEEIDARLKAAGF
jgi:hypothetical protein